MTGASEAGSGHCAGYDTRVPNVDALRSDSGARGREPDRVLDLLDLHAGRIGFPVLDDAGIAALLTSARRIAIVGASPRPDRPSHGVMRDLRAAGYEVIPITPTAIEIDGLACYGTVAEAVAATGPVDIVDVFRRPDACAEHARDAVAAGARCLWLQLGIASREAGLIAHRAGLSVVMDRCTSIELRRLRGVRG
jgi:predicted CoA-binding protein